MKFYITFKDTIKISGLHCAANEIPGVSGTQLFFMFLLTSLKNQKLERVFDFVKEKKYKALKMLFFFRAKGPTYEFPLDVKFNHLATR